MLFLRARATGDRRGNAMIVGLMMGVLLGFSALSVDIGTIRVADTQLQAAIDAAVISGASELDGTLSGITNARNRAIAIAAANPVMDTTLAVPASEVEIGEYDPDTDTFTLWDGISPPTNINAVRIDYTPPQIGSVLGSVAFGISGYDVNGRSIATRPMGAGTAVSTQCYLPIAVPDCWVTGVAPGTNPAPLKFTFTPSPTDAIAWGDPDGNPNSAAIRDQLLGQCDDDEIEVDDPIFVNEGSHTTALQTVADIINDVAAVEPSVWDTSLYGPIPPRTGLPDTANTPPNSDVLAVNWGKVVEGPVALVDAGADCSAVSFTGSKPMTGVAWAVIYDVKSSGSGKNIYVQLDIVNEHEIWGQIDLDEEGNVLGTGDPMLVNF